MYLSFYSKRVHILLSPLSESVLPATIIVEQSPYPHLNPWALCILFFPSFFLEGGEGGGSEKAVVVELSCPAE